MSVVGVVVGQVKRKSGGRVDRESRIYAMTSLLPRSSRLETFEVTECNKIETLKERDMQHAMITWRMIGILYFVPNPGRAAITCWHCGYGCGWNHGSGKPSWTSAIGRDSVAANVWLMKRTAGTR